MRGKSGGKGVCPVFVIKHKGCRRGNACGNGHFIKHIQATLFRQIGSISHDPAPTQLRRDQPAAAKGD